MLSGILYACPHCAAKLIDQGEEKGETGRWFCPKCKVKFSTDEVAKKSGESAAKR